MPKINFASQDYIRERDVDEALRELHAAITAVNTSMEFLAARFPGVTAIAAIDSGEPCGPLAFAQWREGTRFNSLAMDAAMKLARIVGSLPEELADVFAIEVRRVQELRQREGEIKAAREAVDIVLRLKAEKRSE